MAWMAVLDVPPPPRCRCPRRRRRAAAWCRAGVRTYLRAIARETVDSCRPTSPATSRSVSGRSACAPNSRKPDCCADQAALTLSRVSPRASMLLQQPARLLQPAAQVTGVVCGGACRSSVRSRGGSYPRQVVVRASATRQTPCWRQTTQSGVDVGVVGSRRSARRAADRANAATARASLTSSASQPSSCASPRCRPWQALDRARRRSAAPAPCPACRPASSPAAGQAFAERARADAGRVETLDLVQHGQDLVTAGDRSPGAGSRRWLRAVRAGSRRRRARRSAPRRCGGRAATDGSDAAARAGGPAGLSASATRSAAVAVLVVVVERRRCAWLSSSHRHGPIRRALLRRCSLSLGAHRRVLPRRPSAGDPSSAAGRVVGPVEQGIALDRRGDLGFEFGRGQLQQVDRLTQLRRHAPVAGRVCLEAWASFPQSDKTQPWRGTGPRGARLQAESFAQVDAAHVGIGQQRVRSPLREHAAFVEDIRAVADSQGLADVVVGDQHADAAVLEVA